ncbi:MAG TPA: aminoglycoside phosphotransferase family protein [Sphingomicrobium sp.]|nr:aminoglycoside phosphotransferase family protein [Sphingomicrobium sp.]
MALPPEQLSAVRQPLERELAAAREVAARAGLGQTEPKILNLAHHTTVHLSPTPIAARICGASIGSDAKLRRELQVARHLASRGAPTVRPASTISAGPYFENGCAITLWEFVSGRPPETAADTMRAAQALQRVHTALQGAPRPLPSFTVAFDSCERILSNPPQSELLDSSDRVFLQTIYTELREQLSRRELDLRPLHGDAHLGNVLLTNPGAVWMDLDDVCTGPLEWDVACLPGEAWAEFPGIDRELVQLLNALRRVCVTVWCWADSDRSSETREAAIDHLQQLKTRFASQEST